MTNMFLSNETEYERLQVQFVKNVRHVLNRNIFIKKEIFLLFGGNIYLFIIKRFYLCQTLGVIYVITDIGSFID